MYSNSYSSPILMKLEFSRQIFEKCFNIKFPGNLFNENKIVPCGRTVRGTGGRADGRTDGRTDGRADGRAGAQTYMTKIVVAFRSFVNSIKTLQNSSLF